MIRYSTSNLPQAEMKIALSGTGGVGKTTVAALLARAVSRTGRRVIAIDADPDSNLAASLGHPDPDRIVPLSAHKDLINERVGTGGVIRLNPRVWQAFQYRGELYLRLGRAEAALRDFMEAIGLAPEEPHLRFLRDQAMEQLR